MKDKFNKIWILFSILIFAVIIGLVYYFSKPKNRDKFELPKQSNEVVPVPDFESPKEYPMAPHTDKARTYDSTRYTFRADYKVGDGNLEEYKDNTIHMPYPIGNTTDIFISYSDKQSKYIDQFNLKLVFTLLNKKYTPNAISITDIFGNFIVYKINAANFYPGGNYFQILVTYLFSDGTWKNDSILPKDLPVTIGFHIFSETAQSNSNLCIGNTCMNAEDLNKIVSILYLGFDLKDENNKLIGYNWTDDQLFENPYTRLVLGSKQQTKYYNTRLKFITPDLNNEHTNSNKPFINLNIEPKPYDTSKNVYKVNGSNGSDFNMNNTVGKTTSISMLNSTIFFNPIEIMSITDNFGNIIFYKIKDKSIKDNNIIFDVLFLFSDGWWTKDNVLPKNLPVTIGFHVDSVTAKINQICVGNTCITENELEKIKNIINLGFEIEDQDGILIGYKWGAFFWNDDLALGWKNHFNYTNTRLKFIPPKFDNDVFYLDDFQKTWKPPIYCLENGCINENYLKKIKSIIHSGFEIKDQNDNLIGYRWQGNIGTGNPDLALGLKNHNGFDKSLLRFSF